MNKRGYYFIVDALIAVMILVIGFMLISTFYVNRPERIMMESAVNDIMDFLAATKLDDLCNEEGKCTDSAVENAYRSYIKNIDNSILEAIGELSVTGHIDIAANIIQSLVINNNMVPAGFNFTFSLKSSPTEQVMIYPKEGVPAPIIEKSKAVVSARKIIFGYFYEETIVYWPPLTAEASILRIEHFIRCKTNADCRGDLCDTDFGICTDRLVRSGDFCLLSCNDYRYYCENFQCIKKFTTFQQFCTNEAACGPGYYCHRLQCVWTPGDVGDPCGYNNDCNQGLICSSGICTSLYSNEGDGCSVTKKCGAGFYCDGNVCKKAESKIGSKCDDDLDCGRGTICVDKICQQGINNRGSSCEKQEECGPGLVCSSGKCALANCVKDSDCGNDQDCNTAYTCEGDSTKTCRLGSQNQGSDCKAPDDREPAQCFDGLICNAVQDDPNFNKCVATIGLAGESCVTDSDCSCGNICDNNYCYNGKSKKGDGCKTQYECGPTLYCSNSACIDEGGKPGDKCSTMSDCDLVYEGNITICLSGFCYKMDNENHPCKNQYDCGLGLFCATDDKLCHKGCQKKEDCLSGLDCINGFCTSGTVNDTGICGDGIINPKTEQCEEGMTTTCTELDCNDKTPSQIVNCNLPKTEDECHWNTTSCVKDSCPDCSFPADCNEDCAVSPGEAIWIINQVKKNSEPYYCGGNSQNDYLTPTGKMAGCALALYSLRSYDESWINIIVNNLGSCVGIPKKTD